MTGKPRGNRWRKRQRGLTSEGHHSPSPAPQPSSLMSFQRRDVADQFKEALLDYVKDNSPAADELDNLACPFLKHDPERYAFVKNSCTDTGFKNAGSLKDHIKRVHSLKYGCTKCHSHRFNVGEKELTDAKAKHRRDCKGSKKKGDVQKNSPEPLEWMTEEQEQEYDKLDLRKSRQDMEETFRKIYTQLWPQSVPIPDYRHGPGSRVSVFVVMKVLEKMSIEPIETTRRSSSASLPIQQPLSYKHDAAVDPDPEEDPITEQEPADILGDRDPYYEDFVNSLGASTQMITADESNGVYLGHTYYENTAEPAYPIATSFPSPSLIPQLNRNSSGGSEQPNMSQPLFHEHVNISEHVNMAQPKGMEPFIYALPRSTGPSDSGYGTNDTDGCNTQSRLPPPLHSHYGQSHNVNFQANDGLAFSHTGGEGGPDNPPDGDELQLEEEDNVGDEFTTMFDGYPTQENWGIG